MPRPRPTLRRWRRCTARGITLSNLGSGTRQGDYAFFGLCEKLGARVERSAARTVIEGPRKLTGGFDARVDMTSMPDVAPTLMMLAPFLARPTRITGLATLRVKECDRIAAPTRELRKLGVTVEEGPDYMVIEPLVADPSRATGQSWKSRPITTIASRCRLACWLAPAGPADPRSGLRREDLSELLEGLATGPECAAS